MLQKISIGHPENAYMGSQTRRKRREGNERARDIVW
jgi:hypothetical protein